VQLNKWLDEGIIQISCFDYANSITLVKKKDGTNKWRIYIDYRKLNERIIKTQYPLSIIKDQIDHLQGVFNTIDLKWTFSYFSI